MQNTDSFEEAVVTAVNRGHDADTSGAITGQLAGRIYGIDGDKAIPDWMYESLYAQSQTAKYLNLSKKSLQHWRFNRQGPPYMKLNMKTIRY